MRKGRREGIPRADATTANALERERERDANYHNTLTAEYLL